MRIVAGLPEDLRGAAAGLCWEAFRDDLWRLLGPPARARRLLERVIRPDHAFAAIASDGSLAGIAGFRSPQGGFLMISTRALCEVYGPLGGAWRTGLFRLATGEVENRRFLVDAIVIAPHLRCRGIGTALLAALAEQARYAGYRELRLEVAHRNTAARRLYERQLFVPLREDRPGLWGRLAGFDASTVMVRRLGEASGAGGLPPAPISPQLGRIT